jgi:hypothetical protein
VQVADKSAVGPEDDVDQILAVDQPRLDRRVDPSTCCFAAKTVWTARVGKRERVNLPPRESALSNRANASSTSDQTPSSSSQRQPPSPPFPVLAI